MGKMIEFTGIFIIIIGLIIGFIYGGFIGFLSAIISTLGTAITMLGIELNRKDK